MLSLPELQARFAHGLRGETAAELLAAIEPDGLSAAARLQIYANHFRVSVADALAANFPVVRRLVGEACFGQVARQFLRREPPRSPCLADYGAGFPAFLATLEPLRPVPYLAGVARLEWAMVQARHAPEAPVGTLAAGDGPALAAAEHLLFAFAPAARLVASRWPVDQIWRANQGDMPEDRPLALEPRGARLLVHRDGEGDVAWFRLARADFALLRALHAGDTLGRALCFARAAEPAFDPLPLLRALIQAEVLLDAVLLMPLERIR